ncbi:MAG: zinc ribbon domain-containing protein [Lachnospiraceae bacterium]|nr:zinc ribbon domain-containing protein [Lachnospiraceae bacterium]MDD7327176.1 zinc ribbon domain-containing protein [Lachnospiraceae bacterium]MDY2759040.1 zinc ribbon domain-containing protein [Lachnospiraceae bacterium]
MGFFNTLEEAGRGIGAAAKDAAKTAQLNVRLKDLDGKLHKEYEVIGQKYYKDHPDEDTPENRKIKEIFAQIAATKDQLADIRGESICPSCGEFVEKGAKFCSHCGASLVETVDEDDMTVEEPETKTEDKKED